MNMTVDQIREYLRDKIDNSWYANARIDYGVSGRFLDAQPYGDQGQHLYIFWEEDGKRYRMPVDWWTEYTAEQVYNIWMEFAGDDDTEELPPEKDTEPEPTGTQSIKFFWNGIKINGEKKLIRCSYSLDSRHDGRECVTIYARDYSGHLPGDMFPVENGTDLYTDYFETDRVELFPGHPLYAYARAAAIKAELRNEKYYRADTCVTSRAAKMRKLLDYKRELETLPAGHPTAADVEAVHAMNLAAETARVADEKEQEQKEREDVLAMRNAGRAYIEETAARYPVKAGDPVVTIQWSEHPAFYSWEEGDLKLSVAAAEIVLRHYDELRAEHNAATQSGGCDKTSFLIEYTAANGELSTYEGCYDLGDNGGGLIAHIRAFAETYRDKRLPYHSEEEATQISALADFLEGYTAVGRVVSVTVAPWIEEAVKAHREAAQRHMRETMETLELLTDEQLTAAVLVSPRDNPDVARFFLQELSRRDTKKALAVLRAWKEGLGPEDIDRIA